MQQDTQQPTETSQAQPTVTTAPPQPEVDEQPSTHPFAPQNLAEPPKHKKPIGKIMLIIGGVLLLIGVGLGIGWCVFKGDKAGPKQATQ